MKEQIDAFILGQMKDYGYDEKFSKGVVSTVGIYSFDAFVLSQIEVTTQQKSFVKWFLSTSVDKTKEISNGHHGCVHNLDFVAKIFAGVFDAPDFDKDQLVGQFSTEETISQLMWMFGVGYTAKMFTLGQLHVETGNKLTQGHSLTITQWFTLKDLLTKICDGKTQTTPAQMAKAIYKTVFKNSSIHFDLAPELIIQKEETMSINIEPTKVPPPVPEPAVTAEPGQVNKHPFYHLYDNAKINHIFDPLWENGTGYFNGAAEGANAPVLEQNTPARSQDELGRKIVIINLAGNNIVFFERYIDMVEPALISCNTTSELARKYHCFSGHLTEEQFNDILQANLHKYENSFSKEESIKEEPVKEEPMKTEDKPDDWKFHPTNDQGTYNKKPIVEEEQPKPDEPAFVPPVKPWYKKPLIIGSIATTVVAGAAAVGYFAFRK